MKTKIILLTLLAAGSLAAQPNKPPTQTQSPPAPPAPALKAASAADHDAIAVTKPAKTLTPMAGRKVVYGGMLVQAAHTDHPLQLLNPVAPPEYGDGHQNLERDAITGKPTGAFKIFTVSF